MSWTMLDTMKRVNSLGRPDNEISVHIKHSEERQLGKISAAQQWAMVMVVCDQASMVKVNKKKKPKTKKKKKQ